MSEFVSSSCQIVKEGEQLDINIPKGRERKMKEEGMDRKGALELVYYILKRLKGVARDLDDHGHEDLSKVLFVKAAEIDDEICKIETKEKSEAFNEVRNQGYNQALADILHEFSNWAGDLDLSTLKLVDICKKFRKE